MDARMAVARSGTALVAFAFWRSAAAACSTSVIVTAPCGPVPVTVSTSTPRPAAMRRAAGETHRRRWAAAAGADALLAGLLAAGLGATAGADTAVAGAPLFGGA